ncbi:hypothetical protein CHS0354_004055 [Potamilus streckersoni]|uniref:C-type lectin domain-containing protein n=1 Tax=Potamilus streckersoni TaxID=2493646 RepID=A0AAE0W8Y8_9BIVA|nr:hypothetical protein CHS0354_004055 [Potamilus streckersoni]
MNMARGSLIIKFVILFIYTFTDCGSESSLILDSKAVTFVQESSANNKLPLSGFITTMVKEDVNQCGLECHIDVSCTSFSFTDGSNVCNILKMDMTDFTKIKVQPSTKYYRAACHRRDYSYVRSLQLCIKVHLDSMNISDANNTCGNEGGYLMMVDTQQKRAYLKELLFGITDDPAFFIDGGKVAGKWYWLAAMELIDVSNGGLLWKEGQPDGSGPDFDCLVISKMFADLGFDDVHCGYLRPFICQIK